MKYRLTKDIPGMGSKGEEFEMGANISMSINDLTLCVIQILHTLGLLEEVKEGKIELLEEIPQLGTPYWLILTTGTVDSARVSGDYNADVFPFKSKNMHKTRESAEEALRLIMES